ncbi:MAG: hypothetical protein H8E46_10415, partial [FCB group bacterium]|nr:hypothetical protein [FCB group bacterium]
TADTDNADRSEAKAKSKKQKGKSKSEGGSKLTRMSRIKRIKAEAREKVEAKAICELQKRIPLNPLYKYGGDKSRSKKGGSE